MRTVGLDGVRINVSQDPRHLIGDLLEFACSSLHINQIEELFAPDGDFFVPDNIAAYRALEVADLPEDKWAEPPIDVHKNEVWVISRFRYGQGSEYLLIEGDELRQLLRKAKALRAGGIPR